MRLGSYESTLVISEPALLVESALPAVLGTLPADVRQLCLQRGLSLAEVSVWEDPLEKGIGYPFPYSWASLLVQLVKNLPASVDTQETWAQSLGWEDPLEKGIATHSSILAWRIPWTV